VKQWAPVVGAMIILTQKAETGISATLALILALVGTCAWVAASDPIGSGWSRRGGLIVRTVSEWAIIVALILTLTR
jgi:hypothetical protein